MWEALGGVMTKARVPVLFVLGGIVLLIVGAARSLPIMGADLTASSPIVSWLLIGLGMLLIVSGVAAHFLAPASADHAASGARTRPVSTAPRYDVFLAVPMSGTRDEAEYQEMRGLALDVVAAMEAHCGVKTCYFSGRGLATKADFESEAVSAQVDFEALRNADNFVMIYPRPILSSIIAEAGFAIGEGIPSVYLAQGDTRLPFLLAEAHALPRPGFPMVVIHHYPDRARLLRLIENDGARFLPNPAGGG